MKKNFLKKQIPTIFALIILFLGAGAGVLLVGRDTNFLPRAGPEHTPKQIQITNVTDKSFTVSWVTDAPTTGFVKYGTSESNLSNTEIDDRDQLSGQPGNFTTHHITITNLTANTKYFFKLGSGPNQAFFDNNGKPYVLTTGAALGVSQQQDTAYGTVSTPAQTPAEGSLVYLKMPGAAPLSSLVKASGSWAIPISAARTQDLTRYFDYNPDTQIINLEIIGPDGSKTIGVTNTSHDQPTPPIILGQNFDFTTTNDSTNQNLTSYSSSPTPAPTPTPPNSSSIKLLNLTKDGDLINTTKPEFRGQAPPNTNLKITVESPVTYQDEVTTDEQGNFSWTPPADLEPGDHTLTIAYIDEFGEEQTFTRTFTILAQDDNPLPSFTSSPSASPQPTSTPTPVPTIIPTPTATPTPTITPTPTSTPATSTSSATIPVAGNFSFTLIFLSLGASLVLSGLAIYHKNA